MPLQGQVSILREETEADQAQLVALRNDLATQAWNKALPPDYTLEMYLKRYHDREFSYDRTSGNFIIEYKPTGDFAGYIGYRHTRSRHDAHLGIMVHKHFWGSGVAFDAQETLLGFLFRELGLRVVRLGTTGGNKAAIGLAEKSGFKEVIRRREAAYLKGALQDAIEMDLLREEWFALHPEYDDLLPNPFAE